VVFDSKGVTCNGKGRVCGLVDQPVWCLVECVCVCVRWEYVLLYSVMKVLGFKNTNGFMYAWRVCI